MDGNVLVHMTEKEEPARREEGWQLEKDSFSRVSLFDKKLY